MERVVPITVPWPLYVPTEEIDLRNGGCGIIFENKLYVWGGNTADVRTFVKPDSDSSSNSDNDDSEKKVFLPVSLPRSNDKNHPFDVLDLATNKWFRQSTSGEYPTLGLGSSLSVHHPSRTIILFSGFKKYFQFDNEVYKVSPDREWVWEKVVVMSEVKPSERYLTGVIIHNDRMCVFGGVGRASREIGNPPQPQDPGAKYLAYVEDGVERDYGWTSEYLEFDINTSEWEAPLDKYAFRPDPLGSHAFSKFDSHRAVLFGGNGSLVFSNTCYILDLDSREWSGPYKPDDPEDPWPIATRFSTLTSLVDPENVWQEVCGQILQPRMVLLWGKSSKLHISPETWLLEFDFDNRKNPLVWKKLKIGVEPRSWHIARAVYSDKTTSCKIVVFGGSMYQYPITDMFHRDNIANLKILHFGLASLAELCQRVIVSREELTNVAEGSYGSGNVAKLIRAQQSRNINCPLTTDITHVLTV